MDALTGLNLLAQAAPSMWREPIVWLKQHSSPLDIIGYTGNVFFFTRFLVQWIASERAGKPVLPPMFWYLSILGTIALFAYSIAKQEPVFILAYAPNVFVYVRNLMLHRKDKNGQLAAKGAA